MRRIPFIKTKEQLLEQFTFNISFLDQEAIYYEDAIENEIKQLERKPTVFGAYELNLIESLEDLEELECCNLTALPQVGDIVLTMSGIAFYKSFVESLVYANEIHDPRSAMVISFHELLLDECERAGCL